MLSRRPTPASQSRPVATQNPRMALPAAAFARRSLSRVSIRASAAPISHRVSLLPAGFPIQCDFLLAGAPSLRLLYAPTFSAPLLPSSCLIHCDFLLAGALSPQLSYAPTLSAPRASCSPSDCRGPLPRLVRPLRNRAGPGHSSISLLNRSLHFLPAVSRFLASFALPLAY